MEQYKEKIRMKVFDRLREIFEITDTFKNVVKRFDNKMTNVFDKFMSRTFDREKVKKWFNTNIHKGF